MNIIGMLLLAISLSMDALGIGASYGLRGIRVSPKARVIIGVVSMLFTAAAMAVGDVLLWIIPPQAARLLGSGMLAALGLFIILQSFWKKNRPPSGRKEGTVARIALKPLGITVQIIRDPVSCDLDGSRHIDALEALYLGIALSIDSFGAGVSSAVSGVNSLLTPLVVGVCQILFLTLGELLGTKLKLFRSMDSQVFVVISGALLMVLAVVRYFC